MAKSLRSIWISLAFVLPITLLLGLGARFMGRGLAFASGPAELWINPATTFIGVGDSGMVELELNNASGAYGVQLVLGYDPAMLQIVDADGGTGGVQISSAGCPDADFIVLNEANNGSGQLDYAVSQLNPNTACSGGTLAQIEFQCLSPGSTDIEIVNSVLANASGQAITHGVNPAQIICSGATPVPAQVSIDPADGIGGKDIFTSSVQISGASDLYGVELRLAFDSQILQIIDSDAGTPGIQVSSGACPQADFTVLNLADNASGDLDYVVSQLNPTPGCSGGQTLEIQFQCAGVGTSPLDFTQTILADSNGQPIHFETTDSEVMCTEMGV